MPVNPSDPALIAKPLRRFSRQMKKWPTPAERQFWEVLSWRYPKGKSSRQLVFGWYILDFVVHEKLLVIELDGSSHDGREDYDARRDAWIKSSGLTVLRFPNSVAMEAPGKILSAISEHRPSSSLKFQAIVKQAKERKRRERNASLARKGLAYNGNGRLEKIAKDPIPVTPPTEFRTRPEKKRCADCNRCLARRWAHCKCGLVINHAEVWPERYAKKAT
jgi:very-short-patch-repair endonuclease